MRPFGKGKVIVFGGMPFQDSELAIEPYGWDTIFVSILDVRGIKRDLSTWDFIFPETGGEVETFDLLR